MRDDLVVGARVGVCSLGFIVGLSALMIARANPSFSFAGTGWAGATALLAAGWGLVAAGFSVSMRRQNRLAGLLAVAGIVWLAGEWDNPGVGSALIFTIGLVLIGTCAPFVAWAALAFPSGTLTSPTAKGVVVGGFLVGGGLMGLVSILLFDPAAAGCASCAPNLFQLTDRPDSVVDVNRVALGLGAGWAILAVVLVTRRWARSSSTGRRATAAVAATGVGYLATIAVSYLAAIQRGLIGSGEFERKLWFLQAMSLAGLALAVLWEQLRARRIRSTVTRLVFELDQSATGSGLDGLLATVLGDTGAELAYPLGDDRYVGRDGSIRGVPPADGRSWTPIVRDGVELAVLLHRANLFEEIALPHDLTNATGLILENERLQAQARARESELRESRIRLVETSDAERRRLERDLHDGAQQRLVVLLIGTRVARAQLTPDDGPLAAELDEIVRRLETVIAELREIAHGIHPSVLTDDGLPPALEALSDRRCELRLSLVGLDAERLPPSVEHAAYQVVAESSRDGPTEVTATHVAESLSIDVRTARVPDTIVELEDRIGALGGSILIESSGSPITMRVEIPCAS